MDCYINIDWNNAKSLSALKDFCGTNTKQLYNYITTVIRDIDKDGNLAFTEEFKHSWKANEPLDINTTSPQLLKDNIISFFNNKYATVSEGARLKTQSEKVITFGYTSVGAREEAKEIFVDQMIQFYNIGEEKGYNDNIENLQAFYVMRAINSLSTTLSNRLAEVTNIDAKTIYDNIKANPGKYIFDILQKYKDKINLQTTNLAAVIIETNTTSLEEISDTTSAVRVNPYLEFVSEVMLSSKLNSIRLGKKESSEEALMKALQQETGLEYGDIDVDNESGEIDFDTYIQTLNNKLGLTSTYLIHLGDRVKSKLRSLKVMRNSEDGRFVADTNNFLGIAKTMDVNKCATVLYNYGRFDNPEIMLTSIQEIADRIPGFGAFSKLYSDLRNDTNLCLQFYRTFSKPTIGKLETITQDGKTRTHITNNNLNRTEQLKYRFENSLKSTSLSVDHVYNKRTLLSLKTDCSDYDAAADVDGSNLRELASRLTKQLNLYYTDIDELTIRNFILLHKNVNSIVNTRDNILTLVNRLDETITAAEITKENYDNLESKIYLIREKNSTIEKAMNLADSVGMAYNGPQKQDISPIYMESYIDTTAKAHAETLAKLLVDYTLLDTSLNTRNVEGNQSSDVINNSMLTNIKETLESQLNTFTEEKDKNGTVHKTWNPSAPIVRLGEHRFQSTQYNFSNILIERRDEKGNVINYGLFYETIDATGNKRFVPTDYCTTLLQIRLFDGASNLDDGNNVLYSKMSKGDYIGTAWRNFFKTTNYNSKVEHSADYFMRIPSDAPKTFAITAPRYTIDGLFKVENEAAIEKEITTFIENVFDNQLENVNDVFANRYPILVRKYAKTLNLDTFITHLTSDKTDIKIPINRQRDFKDNKNRIIKLAFRYANSDGNKQGDNVYVMEGVYYDGVLHNAHFVGFKKDSTDSTIIDDIRKALWTRKDKEGIKGNIIRTVNTNHPIFKQLYNAFTQELTDMAVASSVMFKLKLVDKNKGLYRIDTDGKGRPKLNDSKTSIVKSNTEHNGLSPVYHFADPNDDGKGEIFKYDTETGKVELTGKVFSSDKFILYDYFAKEGESPIKNFGNNILNEAFSLLRNSSTNQELEFHFTKTGEIDINDTQKKIIETQIKNFIFAYVEHARTKMESVNDFVSNIDGAEVNTNTLADFMLNYHLMYNNFNDLFEGDTKFYKNTQTFLKRAKESQGSGVPYGFMDYTRPIQPGHNHINSPLDDVTFIYKSPNKKDVSYKVEAFDTFKAITIHNTTRTDVPMLETLVHTLTDKSVMGKYVLTEDKARELLYGPIVLNSDGTPKLKDGQPIRKGGYQETVINDAQSYITFPEFIRRITAKGELPKYKPLIDKILDETQPLTVDDIKAFIQVQKNFYYDQYYNEKTKTIQPRQIKNAEFVLVPRLIKGTELEKVNKMMNKLGVDQLNTSETSKAAQSEKFTLWDENGHISQDILNDIDDVNDEYVSDIMVNGKSAIEYYNYNYLYTQQETPQHINDENKAGIQVMKKIIDNISDDAPEDIKKAKEEFFNLYAANIHASFIKLMERFKVELDDNGQLKLKNNKTKDISKIDYEEFLKALKQELIRLGLDSNAADYCTSNSKIKGTFSTVMPNYMSLVGPKFENIVQSLFNNSITRQTLPGFHAAQISGMGFRPLSEQVNNKMTSNILQYHPQLYKLKNSDITITQREYDLLTKDEQKNYIKDKVANYVEIMLPASNFGFDRNSEAANVIRNKAIKEGKSVIDAEKEVDAMFLQQLKLAGADEIIGYRIPTEGKQSACCMKVVGFTNDAYGSTIVVPDAWVSQTGSDFDIDSVYGIQYTTRFDKKGNLKVIQYIKDDAQLYKNYVFRYLTDSEIKAAFEDAKVNDETFLEFVKANTNSEGKLNREELFNDVRDYKNTALIGVLEDLAKSKNLESYEQYSKHSVEERNSQAARNNRLLDDMRLMLNHIASMEENLSRSNFDKVTSALQKCIVGDNKIQRAARTAYNILDQADYQEDAMSGLMLKAFSVVRDTFCSICNTIRPTLENNSYITVKYPATYDVKELEKRFNKYDKKGNLVEKNVNIDSSTGEVTVTHRTFGWSNDNKNVDGSILTSYSSQTTAHILDAMKSGNVPNVNGYTFQVYKTIVDVGSNYDTAVSFIMQPGVSRIVEAYNKTNSIYAENKGKNYVLEAVRSILDDLNLEYDYNQTVEDLIMTVNSQYSMFIKQVFKDKITLNVKDDILANVALDSTMQLQRLEESGIFAVTSPVDERAIAQNNIAKLIYDLYTILQYSKINKLADNVADAARVCNPDKFGAKQTIFSTRKVFTDIVDTINSNITDFGNMFRLQVNGQNILSVIYPRMDEAANGQEALDKVITDKNFVKDSKYKSLAAFLKYATATSVKINKTLFKTQSDEFIDIILNPDTGLQSVLSDGNYVTEKTAKEFTNYIVNYIVRKSEFLQAPLKYNKGKGGLRGFEYIGKAPREYNYDEASRVFGYGYPIGLEVYKYDKETNKRIKVPFVVENVANPTQDEIDLFASMSPAQKITWIKRHFRDAGIFKYINCQLFNEWATRRKQVGMQTISYNEEAADPETIYREFSEAFSNKNPLLALAAADIIKYAFFVEGYKIGIGNVSKVIANSALVNGGRIYGTNIVNDSNDMMNNIDTTMDATWSMDSLTKVSDVMIERFVRSHSDKIGINYHNVSRLKNGYELSQKSGKLIMINSDTEEGRYLLEKYSIASYDKNGIINGHNAYVRLKFGKDEPILYQVKPTMISNSTSIYYLIPLNKLEENENAEWSSNPHNWEFRKKEYYETLIEKYNTAVAELPDLGTEYHSDVMSLTTTELNQNLEKYIKPKNIKKSLEEPIPINDINNNPSYGELVRNIREWYPTAMTEAKPRKYIWNTVLEKNIRGFGKENSITDTIILEDGTQQVFNITKVYIGNYVKKYTGENINAPIKNADKRNEELISLIRQIAKHNSNNEIAMYYPHIYAIEPTEIDLTTYEGLDFSSILDVAVQSSKAIYSRSKKYDDREAANIAEMWNQQGIVATREGISPNVDDVIIETAKYIETQTNEIIDKLKHFELDPKTGKYLPVDDIDCINIIKKNPVRRKEYLKLIQEPRALVEQFSLIKELDVDSEDPNIQVYLNKIKHSIEKLQNLTIVSNAEERFAKEYYNKLTDEPLVKKGYMSVLDGFRSSTGAGGWLNAMFNDIQEASNPIVQISMKNFQADLRAKQFEARRRADEFIKKIDEIKKEALKNGKTFDLNNVIDSNGRFKQTYKNKLIEDRDRLRRKVYEEAKKQVGSLEHLKAKLEYDEWKAKYIEQPLVQEFYDKKNSITRQMLYPDPNNIYLDKLAQMFSKYETLRAEKAKLSRKIQENVDDSALAEQYDNIVYKMWDLTHYNYETDSDADKILKEQLHDYVTTIRQLYKIYFKHDPVYNFDDLLAKNKDIIEKYEFSDKPSSIYIDNPEYVAAKNWFRKNVDVVPDYESDMDVEGQLEAAYDSFTPTYKHRKPHAMRRNKKYINKLGEFDPRLIDDEQIDALKQDQLEGYGLSDENTFVDKMLLSNEDPTGVVYTKEFYEGMSSDNSKTNKDAWKKTITAINELLTPLVDIKNGTNEIDFSKLNVDENKLKIQYGEELIELLKETYNTDDAKVAILKELRTLYNKLSNIKGDKKSKKVKEFIENNVDLTAYNESKYKQDVQYIEDLPASPFKQALFDLIRNIDYNQNVVPNNYLYGIIKPKGKENLEKYTDTAKTEAIKTINKYKTRVLSPYYDAARAEARKTMSDEDYWNWYHRNHVYNPYTRAYEPLDIWWEVKDKVKKFNYYPAFSQQTSVVRDGHFSHREIMERKDDFYDQFDTLREAEEHYFKDWDFRNPNYKDDLGHGGNYKVGSNAEYDNKISANKYELEAMEYMQKTLMALANTQDSKTYLKNGWLPARHIGRPTTAKGWVKELMKSVGFVYENVDPADWYDDISLAKDRPGQMPMLEKVKGSRTKPIPARPTQGKTESDADFNTRLLKWEEEKAEQEKINMEEHEANLDKDWINVVADFIVKAGTYNAVQDNKYELFYALQLLKRYGAYVSTYSKNGKRRFKRDRIASGEETEYLRKPDKYLIEQFENQLRRIVYNQFKSPNNPKLLRAMSLLQSLTSAQYMMLNVKGGIANVTLGESQIAGEAFAGEFFGIDSWTKGKLYYSASAYDYILHMNDDKANTIAGAIIKFMDVVDYDEHTGVSRLTTDAYEVLKKCRDAAYTPQTAGEHGMQNSAMFSMMYSHRLFYNPRAEEFGQPKYIFRNLMEYQIDCNEKALLDILTADEQKQFKEYKDKIISDANEFKDFAWYKKDFVTEFAITRLDNDNKRKFIRKCKEIKKTYENEFKDNDKHPTIISQLDLGEDGKLKIKEGSLLDGINKINKNGEPSDALKFLASFKGRVISVNKYIHGVYDKSGRAQFEKTFIGSLLMQYHKHLPIGLFKRYRTEGMWNEERGAVTKGVYRSLFDFISMPIDKIKSDLELSDESVMSLKGVQNIFRNCVDFLFHINIAYNLLPDYDKANLRRMWGDMCGVLAAVALTIAIKAGADKDDEDSLLYNLALYEADRLATEAGQYIPFVAYTEAKKLWQSPIAAGSGITDMLSSLNMLAHMITDGDDFDGEYHSGKFAGESKIKVYLERRIPIWRGIKSSFIDIKTNNKFYKIGDNLLNFVDTNAIAKDIKGK